MRLIDADSINPNIYEISPKKFGVFQEVAKKLSTMQAIPVDKVKQAREEIENLTPWDEGTVEMYEVLAILDKLIAGSEEK